jgi:DNA-binding HxlR family transcriptional regulator
MKSVLAERSCPRVEAAFSLLSRKWTGLIIRALISSPLHFCELEKSLPALSARVLALRMRELEDSGIVHRGLSDSSPPRARYELTEKGRDLEPVIAGIAAWATRWE